MCLLCTYVSYLNPEAQSQQSNLGLCFGPAAVMLRACCVCSDSPAILLRFSCGCSFNAPWHDAMSPGPSHGISRSHRTQVRGNIPTHIPRTQIYTRHSWIEFKFKKKYLNLAVTRILLSMMNDTEVEVEDAKKRSPEE